MSEQIKVMIAIAIGGGVGSVLRWGWALLFSTTLFPIGTLLVNLLGSFLLGTLSGILVHHKLSKEVRLGLGVGLCGGFTTMSTFAFEVVELLSRNSLGYAGLYILLSIGGGIVLALVGLTLGQRIKPKAYGVSQP